MTASCATTDELRTSREWGVAHFEGDVADLPFSFLYGGKPSSQVLKSANLTRATRSTDEHRTERTLLCADLQTGLVVRCVAIEYDEFPVVEWTVYLRNDGTADTPIVSDVRALDVRFPCDPDRGAVLHHHTGSPCTPADYRPFRTPLGASATQCISTSGGRSSNSDLPYFNVETSGDRSSGGVILAIGWPGQWKAEFIRHDKPELRIRAGQEITHFTLRPGEEVRTPLIALLFWTGDRLRSQNLWRRWMLGHNVPRTGGKLPGPYLTPCSSHQFGEMIRADEASQILFINRYLEERLDPDYWWMDAGWYPNATGWPNTGTWEVDRKRFPRGLRAITDHAHAKGLKSIVWFEPERVTPGTWLWEEHPEWLLGPDGGQKLLDLGNPEARRWLTDHIDRFLTDEGIDLYRQDFNMDPLEYWRQNDAPHRRGITEIGHVTGLLAFWDELRRRHPDLLIDTCASGGRRNDLEILRRAVPLVRSDYIFEPTSQQCHTYGIASWIPYYGTGVIATEEYAFRSIMCPNMIACWDVRRRDLDYALLRRLVGEWRGVADHYSGDYYPLTSYSLENDVWMAWQFDRPDLGTGMVQAFRRSESPYESARFFLRGLGPESRYHLTTLNRANEREMASRELMDRGLVVTIPERPGSTVITYRRVAPS